MNAAAVFSSTPLRIAIAIERFGPDVGGAERSTAQVAERLVERGHAVTVLTSRFGPHHIEPPAPYAVERRGSGGRVKAWTLMRLRQWVSRRCDTGEFDVVLSMTTSFPGHVVEPRAGITAGFQRQRVTRRATPLARAIKSAEIAVSPKQRLLRSMERRTLADPRLRRVVALSELVARQLRELAGVPDDRIEIIPNGSDTPAIDATRRAALRGALRRGLGLPPDTPVLVFAAHDPWRKGGRELLQAMRRVVEARPEARLLIVGREGYALHRAAVDLGVRDHVLLMGRTHRAPDLFAAADAVVLPTWYDPSSKVVIEALMVGTPAITTRLNGAADFVVPTAAPGDTGPPAAARGMVIDSPMDVPGLADAMLTMGDPTKQERFADACRGLHARLTMGRHVDHLEAVLIEAAATRPGKPSASGP